MRKRLLLIDDDQRFLEMMRDVLETEHYELATYTDALDMVSIVMATRPDIVLLDWRLKTENGGELCRRLRASQLFSHLPVILLSGYPEYMLQLDKIPFTIFIPKPFDIWEFLACLAELCGRTNPHA